MKKMSRKMFIRSMTMAGASLALGSVLAACGANTSSGNGGASSGGGAPAPGGQAQDLFPEHEIRHIIPWGAGGSSDRSSRALQPYLDKYFGVPVVMENMDGASGVVGWSAFQQLPPDGYAMTYTNWPVLYSAALLQNADWGVEDFAHIGGVTDDPIVLLSHKDDDRFTDFLSFVDAAKTNPGGISVLMTGPGTMQNVAAQALMDAFGIDINVVNSPGGSGEVNATLAGRHVDLALTNAYSAYSIRESAWCLGVMANRTVPKMWEEGKRIADQTGVEVPNFSVLRGFATHARIKEEYPERYQWLVDKFKQASTDPEYVKANEEAGQEEVVFYTPPDELAVAVDELNAQMDKYRDIWLTT